MRRPMTSWIRPKTRTTIRRVISAPPGPLRVVERVAVSMVLGLPATIGP